MTEMESTMKPMPSEDSETGNSMTSSGGGKPVKPTTKPKPSTGSSTSAKPKQQIIFQFRKKSNDQPRKRRKREGLNSYDFMNLSHAYKLPQEMVDKFVKKILPCYVIIFLNSLIH
jgi:hypothetical protein